jgi:hypothetical protein
MQLQQYEIRNDLFGGDGKKKKKKKGKNLLLNMQNPDLRSRLQPRPNQVADLQARVCQKKCIWYFQSERVCT